jgi:hypothetical protein
VVVKEKNHLDIAVHFQANSKYKVPRDITEDIVIIENENSKGNV